MTFFGFVTWNVNPDIFHLGVLTIRWYGLLFAMAFLVGYFIMERVYKIENLSVKEVDRLSLHMIIGVVVGARLGHVLFYQPDVYLRNPIEILKIWEGGLASHGAAIGILIAMFIYTRRGPVRSYMWILDRIILTVPIGGFFVRMGNLMNSEIYGHVTNLPWGFRFVRDHMYESIKNDYDTHRITYEEMIAKVPPHHPTQIYEGLLYLALFVFLWTLYKKKHATLKPGTLFGLFLILLFSIRFFVEFFKEVQVDFEVNMVANYGLNMGQLLSIPFIVIGIFILIRSMRLKQKETI
jgi:phosphatidylglycerol---prolipoprotein diacylglyceryl transferase